MRHFFSSFIGMFRMFWINLGTQDAFKIPHWSFRTVTYQLFGSQFDGCCFTNPIFRHFLIFGPMDFWRHRMSIIRSCWICLWNFIHFFPLFTRLGILFLHGKNPIVIDLFPTERQRSWIFAPQMDFRPMDLGFTTDWSTINGNFRHSVWKSPKMSHMTFSILAFFNELLSTQNVNLISLAMLNETFSVIFKHCV